MRECLVGIALGLVLASHAIAQARPVPTRTDLEPFVDGIVEAELARNDVAGAVVAIVSGGEIAFVKGYGFADVAKRKRVDEHTLFRMASISKLFTALVVLQLEERGRLELDADVIRVPRLRDPARTRQARDAAPAADTSRRLRGAAARSRIACTSRAAACGVHAHASAAAHVRA